MSIPNPEAEKLAAVLQSIIDGCVHPTIALRRVSVDLAPIRAALKEFHESRLTSVENPSKLLP